MTGKDLAMIELKLKEFNEWHAQAEFSPLVVRPLLEHLKKCHRLLEDLSMIAEWEYPFRITPLIDKAIELRREVA